VEGRVTPATFLRWCISYPELGAAFKLAREISGHMLEDEALEMARGLPGLSGPAPEMSARIRAYDVAMGQLRWSAGKRHPREYGEKAQTTFAVPIQINTSIPLEIGEGMSPQELRDQSRDARGEFLVEARVLPPPPEPDAPAPEPEPEVPGSVFEAARRAMGMPKGGRGWGGRKMKGKANPAVGAALRRLWKEGKYEHLRTSEQTEAARTRALELKLEAKLGRLAKEEGGDGEK
jgi:hypothetical protein